MSLAASWASAFYVKGFAHFGATYGSITAVVVMLIWLSWNVNSMFFGAALATELEAVGSDALSQGMAASPVRSGGASSSES